LGAGDCQKSAAWLPYLRPKRYIPVDIAEVAITQALKGLVAKHPEIEMLGVVSDFMQGMDLQSVVAGEATTVFYPGSSIGNFTPLEALTFLQSMRAHTHGGGLLIGVDTVKDSVRLQKAYDDDLGATAAFNLNGLRHLNRELGGSLDAADFKHVAVYNAQASRIEMHLEAKRAVTVSLGAGVTRHFAAGERIHTENSYKYRPTDFARLLAKAGFSKTQCWQDPAGDFSVFYASE
jgi:L-histidine Nalpha-methyltransferase